MAALDTITELFTGALDILRTAEVVPHLRSGEHLVDTPSDIRGVNERGPSLALLGPIWEGAGPGSGRQKARISCPTKG